VFSWDPFTVPVVRGIGRFGVEDGDAQDVRAVDLGVDKGDARSGRFRGRILPGGAFENIIVLGETQWSPVKLVSTSWDPSRAGRGTLKAIPTTLGGRIGDDGERMQRIRGHVIAMQPKCWVETSVAKSSPGWK
jgi:hypothetical protein